MLAFGISAVGLKNQGNRGKTVAMLVSEFSSEFELILQPGARQGFAGAHHRIDSGSSSHVIQTLSRFDLALKTCTGECALHILGSKFVEHLDDLGSADVGSIGHRRSPVAFY